MVKGFSMRPVKALKLDSLLSAGDIARKEVPRIVVFPTPVPTTLNGTRNSDIPSRRGKKPEVVTRREKINRKYIPIFIFISSKCITPTKINAAQCFLYCLKKKGVN